MSAAPAVNTHNDSRAFSRAKGVSRLRSSLAPVPGGGAAGAYCTVISESGRTGPSSLRVDRLIMRSESTAQN